MMKMNLMSLKMVRFKILKLNKLIIIIINKMKMNSVILMKNLKKLYNNKHKQHKNYNNKLKKTIYRVKIY
jgi:hypothetical protein